MLQENEGRSAETASVFAELLIFHRQLDLLDAPEQRRALPVRNWNPSSPPSSVRSPMNRFEDLIHNSRQEKGELSEEALSDLWMESQKPMFGDSVISRISSTRPAMSTPTPSASCWCWRSTAFIRRRRASFVPGYTRLLNQGGGQSPYDLLKPFNIDLNDPGFWQGGLAVIEEMLVGVEEG